MVYVLMSPFRLVARGAFALLTIGLMLASAAAALSAEPPSIGTRPLSQVVKPGDPITATVLANGDAPLSYTWKRNGRVISGATAGGLNIPAATLSDSGYYHLAVSNAMGSATAVFYVTVAADPLTLVRWDVTPPVFRADLGDLVAIAANSGTLGLKRDGHVIGWGLSINGQTTPPANLANVVGIATDGGNSVAVTSDGAVVSWGDSATASYLATPAGLSGVVAIAAGGRHTLALKADGTVVGWGQAQYGAGVVPAGLADVVAIGAGNDHSVALRADGTVVQWGDVPAPVPTGLGEVVRIGVSTSSTVALRADGTVAAWGSDTAVNAVPPEATNIVAVSAAYARAFAWRTDGSVLTWGTQGRALSGEFAGGQIAAISIGVEAYALVAYPDPFIAVNPVGGTVNAGTPVSFAATAAGTTPLSYRWRKDGVGLTDGGDIAGASTASLRLASAQKADTGTYTLAVTNNRGTAVSAEAVLNVVVPPVIVAQPNAQTVNAGANFTVSVTATDAGALTYQWRKDGVALVDGGRTAGARTATLTVTAAEAADAGVYTVVIANAEASITSAPAVLTVVTLPQFTLRPRSRLVAIGEGLSVSAAAIGPGPIAFSWKRNGQPIPGATASTLSVTAVGRADRGFYEVFAANSYGTVESVFAVDLRPNASGPTAVLQWSATQATSPFAAVEDFVAISQGWSAGLVLRRDGTVAALGTFFELPAGLTDVVAVSSARFHNLVLKADGTTYAWGMRNLDTPAGLKPVVAVAAGMRHNVYLQNDGTVVDTVNAPPAGLDHVVAIAAGEYHGVALKSDGTVVTWPSGVEPPAGLTDIIAISAKDSRNLALRANGTVVGWGSTDVVPAGLENVVAISAGGAQNLALKTDGTVVVWGATAPAPPVGLDKVAAVAAGLDTAAVLFTPGPPTITAHPQDVTVNEGEPVQFAISYTGLPAPTITWTRNGVPLPAHNSNLMLENVTDADAGAYRAVLTNPGGTVTSNAATLTVLHPPRVAVRPIRQKAKAGAPFSLTVAATGVEPLRYQWSTRGQPIAGATSATLSLPNVSLADRGWYELRVTDGAGVETLVRVPIIVMPANGRIAGWSSFTTSELPLPDLGDVTAVALGQGFGLALRATGAVVAWGNNDYGQTTVPSSLADVAAVAAGTRHALALCANGTVVAWGSNSDGQTTVPSGLSNVIAIAAGYAHSLALRADGTVTGWGSTVYGSAVPSTLGKLVAIAARGSNFIGIRENGDVVTWAPGRDPSIVTRGAVAIAAGSSHGLALKWDGSVVDWGNFSTYGVRPVSPGLTDILDVGTSAAQSYCVRGDGTLYSPGYSNLVQPAIALQTNVVAVTGGDVAGVAHFIPTPPSIVVPPVAQTANNGEDVTFAVTATGSLPLQYEWQRNGAALGSGYGVATDGNTLRLPSVSVGDGGLYRVVVTNAYGSVASPAVRLTVLPPADDLTAAIPVRQTVAGQGVTLTLPGGAVTGATYQWRRDGIAVSGGTNPSLVISAAARGDAGTYDVLVSQSGTTVTAGRSILKVAPAAYPAKVAIDRRLNVAAELVDGWIYTITATADGKFYVGGDFSSIDGQLRSRVARFLADGTLDPTFVPADLHGAIYAIQPMPDGKVWVGGSFSAASPGPRWYYELARLNSDGSIDQTWIGNQPTGPVNALTLLPNGQLLVGGSFTDSPAFLRRMNADGSLDLTFNANIIAPSLGGVWCLALDAQQRVLLGGAFTRVAGQTRYGIARLTTSGGIDLSFGPSPGTNSLVFKVAPAPDGSLVAVGAFSSYNSASANGIVRILVNGAIDETFRTKIGDGFDNAAYSVVRQGDGRLVVGGVFTAFNQSSATGLVRLNADGTRDSSFVTGTNNTVAALAAQTDGSVIVGGYFTRLGAEYRIRLARLSAAGALDPSFMPVPLMPGIVDAILPLPGGKILVAGKFHALGGRFGAPNLARLNADLSFDSTFVSGGYGFNDEVTAIAAGSNGRIYAAGAFTQFDGTNRSHIARLQSNGTLDLDFDAGTAFTSAPSALLALPDDQVLAGAIRLTNRGAIDAGFAPNLNGPIRDMVRLPDGRLLLAGDFTNVASTVAYGVARFTAAGGFESALGTITGGVRSLSPLPDGRLVIGGEGILARLNGSLAVDPTFTAPAYHYVHQVLAQEDGRVLAGGAIGPTSQAAAALGRVRLNGALDPTFQVAGLNGLPTAFALLDSGRLLIGGANTPGLAVTTNLTPVVTAQSPDTTVTEGGSLALSVTATGAGTLTYQWLHDGVVIPGATNATLTLNGVRASDAGNYAVVVNNSFDGTASGSAAVTVRPLVTRGLVAAQATAAGALSLRGSFVVEGASSKQMLVRAVGPGLASLGVTGAMADPRLAILDATTGGSVAANDDWSSDGTADQVSAAAARAGASPLAVGSKDAAILMNFSPGAYRVAVGPENASGTVSLEIYDVDTVPRLVYAAARGTVGGDASLVQGFGVLAPPAGRQYLVRALGPALGTPFGLADPRLALFQGETQVAANDDWGANAAITAIGGALGAFPLPTGSRDAALLFTPGGAGVFTARVTAPPGTSGAVLLEVHEFDAQRTSSSRMAVVSPPGDVTANAGEGVRIGVVTLGRPQPTYSWTKDGTALPAFGAVLDLGRVQVSAAGLYTVRVAGGGNVQELHATLAVNALSNATQRVIGRGYGSGATVTIANALYYVGAPSSLGWTVTLPTGWSLASDTATTAAMRPAAGATGTLTWTWTTPPPSPISFAYTLNVPAGETASRTLDATATVDTVGVPVAPQTLSVTWATPHHSTDTDHNWRVSLLELTRAIELYNTKNGTARTGSYAIEPSGEDGFAADFTRPGSAVVTLDYYHSADSNHDGKVSLLELTRVIELYNYRTGTTRTGQYHVQSGTEDGFATGP